MSNEIWKPEDLINQEGIDALTEEQAQAVLDILTKAGY